MAYRIAAIDVHKRLLVVVVADAEEPDVIGHSRRFGTGHAELQELSRWLCDVGVAEAGMESTAQYWKPVWMQLEPHMRLHLAQAQSNRAPQHHLKALRRLGYPIPPTTGSILTKV